MKIIKTPIRLDNDEVVTSLYHSPFDYNLLYLILFAKTGVKLKIVLDDIDNIGVDRSHPNSSFVYKEKYFLSKTERTNLRSLSLILPKHIFLNLAYPNIKGLDKKVGINTLKNVLGYEDTVEHWIKDKTNEMGAYSLIGPDKSFAFMRVDDDFIIAINKAKDHLITLIEKFPNNRAESINFIDWLFSEDLLVKGKKVTDYYFDILNKIIKRFDLSENVLVEKMSDQTNQYNTKKLLDLFTRDKDLQNTYNSALKFLGKKDTEDYPFYSISREDGARMLPIESFLNNHDDYIVAPKVLMLNNFENLILPDHASGNPNVIAREIMYRSSNIKCSQVFCSDNWLSHLSQFDLDIDLDKLEKEFYKKKTLNFKELLGLNFYEGNEISEYKNWVIRSTITSLERATYPLLFLSLLQDKIFYKKPPELYKITIPKI